MKTYTYTITKEAELAKVATALIESIGYANILAFYGKMGAGKTTFIKAICAALQVKDMVNSPTFAIVNQYDTPKDTPIFHFDFYRMESPQEALDIGFDDYIDSGALCLMEWPEKIAPLLPEDCIEIHIDLLPNLDRQISWTV